MILTKLKKAHADKNSQNSNKKLFVLLFINLIPKHLVGLNI